MKTYLVSIMGKKGIFKKEVKAHNWRQTASQLVFFRTYEDMKGNEPFLVIREWILVEEVTE